MLNFADSDLCVPVWDFIFIQVHTLTLEPFCCCQYNVFTAFSMNNWKRLNIKYVQKNWALSRTSGYGVINIYVLCLGNININNV